MEHLSAYEKVKLARDPKRPYFLDYVEAMCTEFSEIHGDRKFGDDPAIITGFAFFHGRPVCLVGHQKGRDTRQKLYRNFGMPKPEGYRKALRVMKLAEKFGMPILTFIDTPGAYPGVDAEERGEAEAIAVNLREMSQIRVPIVATVTGEGGSGGALAIGVADRVNMLEYSIYSVIAPEITRILAGRSPWLCHGTMPPGWTTRRRMRSARPATPYSSSAMEEMTVSVTLAGIIGPGLVTSTPTLFTGHSPA